MLAEIGDISPLRERIEAGIGEPVEGAVAEDRVVEEAEPLLDVAVGGDERVTPLLARRACAFARAGPRGRLPLCPRITAPVLRS